MLGATSRGIKRESGEKQKRERKGGEREREYGEIKLPGSTWKLRCLFAPRAHNLIANSGQRELSRVEKRLRLILYLIANSGQRELCTESVKNV